MDITELNQFRLKLEAERARIDDAIRALERLISQLGANAAAPTSLSAFRGDAELTLGGTRLAKHNYENKGYAAVCYEILKERGRMHIAELVGFIAARRGFQPTPEKRASIESGLHKALASDLWKDKLLKVGRGFYEAR